MEEVSLKRLREGEEGEEETSKRQKSSYTQILSLLDHEEEEEGPNQSDVSSFITSLQQELSSNQPSTSSSGHDPLNPKTETNESCEFGNSSSAAVVDASATETSSSSSSLIFKDDEEKDQEEEKERVMRHLLEASDDELGIPHGEMRVVEDVCGFDDEVVNVGGSVEFSLYDGFWELEDETANYYALFQSHLFM